MALLLTACASQAELPKPPEIETLEELRMALAEAGVAVSEAPALTQPDLGVEPEGLFVGTAAVQAYEYGSSVERRLVSDTIRAGGYLMSGEPVDWPGRPNIWARGQLIVVYPGVDGGTVLLLSGLLGDPLTFEAPEVDEPFPPGILVAIGAAADSTGLSPQEIEVTDYEFRDWPDSCLGLSEPEEMCAEATVPGWLVRLNAAGNQLVFRVDELGSEIREE